MNELIIYYPVKNQINPTNLFGANPEEYFPLGQNGHPGNDFECPIGTPVYAPVDGDAFYTSDVDGGHGIWIRTPSNAKPSYNVILWHMPEKTDTQYPYKIATDGSITKVKAGDLLGYSGNSGFPQESTGPHLHLGAMPCEYTGAATSPLNGYMGCVDPAQFYNHKYAQDISIEQQIVADTSEVVQIVAASNFPNATKLSFWQKVVQILKNL